MNELVVVVLADWILSPEIISYFPYGQAYREGASTRRAGMQCPHTPPMFVQRPTHLGVARPDLAGIPGPTVSTVNDITASKYI
jgi:hypothetical protein